MKRPQSLNQCLEDVKYEQYINNLHDRLPSLVDPSDIDCQRWPWELVQNAKDTVVKRANKDEQFVDAVIKYYIDNEGNKKLYFEHNGDQFTDKAITGLIWKFSAEKRNEQFTEDGISRDKQSTGRFGTGFMTTHALSFTVDISGSLYHGDPGIERNVSVDFTLHREGPSDEEYKKGVDRTEQEIEENMDKRPIPEGRSLPTRFTYHLNKESSDKAAEMGIRNVRANAAQTMLFCPTVRSITVEDEINKTVFKITRENSDDRKNVVKETVFLVESSESPEPVRRRFISIEIEEYSEAISSHWKAEGRNLRLHVAVEVDNDNNILPVSTSSPSVYCSLPLIGFEGMTLPFYINSNDFEPSSERTSLYLKKKRFEYHENEDTEENEKYYLQSGINWSILERSLSLYERVVDYLIDNGYTHRYNLVNGLSTILNGAWSVETKNCLASRFVLPLRSMLVKKNLVNTDKGYRSIDSNIKFVECSKDRDSALLYDICKSVYGNDLPIEKDNEKWISLIWTKFKFDDNYDDKNPDNENLSIPTVGYKDIAKYIEDAKTLNLLSLKLNDAEIKQLNETDDEKTQIIVNEGIKLNWLNKFYSWISASKITSLVDKSIVPNRKGDFCSYEQGCALKDGREIHSSVFSFMKEMSIDWDDHLLMEGVKNITLVKETTDNVTIAIKDRVHQIVSDGRDVQKNLLPLLLALPAIKDMEKPTDYYLKRRRIISILSIMYQLHVDYNNCTILDLKSETWENADKWFMESAARTIARRSKLDIVSEQMTNEEKEKYYCTSSWLSETLDFMFEKGYLHQEDITYVDGMHDAISIVPNRYGDFKYINQLYTQGSVPDELLNDTLNATGTNIKESLLHKDFSLNSKISISEYSVSMVASLLNSFFDGEAKGSAKEDVAKYIVHLVPQSGDQYEEVRNLYDEYTNNPDRSTTILTISDLNIWKGTITFVINYLANKTSESDFCTLEYVGKKLLGEYTETLEADQVILRCTNAGLKWINRLSKIVKDSNIQDEKFQLVPDIYGVLHKKTEVSYDGSILKQFLKYDTLVDIVDGKLWRYFEGKEEGDEDFTTTIVHPDYVYHNSYHDNAAEKFFGLVDRLINWCCDNVAATWRPILKASIEALLNFFEKNETNAPYCNSSKLESLFPKTYYNRKALSYDFVYDAETKARIAKINENFTSDELDEIIKQKELFKKILTKLANGESIYLADDSEETKPSDLIVANDFNGVECSFPAHLQYGGLSLDEKKRYVKEAKDAVVKYFREWDQRDNLGLQFDSERINSDSFSQLYGISDKYGKEIPLVVHSFKGPQYRYFNLNWYDWQLLSRPGSMLWVLTGSSLQCIPQYKLPLRNYHVSIDNASSDNCKIALITLGQVGKLYGNVSFDFGNNMPIGFEKPIPFYYVPDELKESIASIKQACDNQIPLISNSYTILKSIPIVFSPNGSLIVYKDNTTNETQREIFESEPNNIQPPTMGSTFID